MDRTLIIGTRGSDLALWQAHFLQQQLKAIGVASRLEIIRTQGDRIQDRAFTQISGTGFFTAELEEALRTGRVDIAVHSLKDLPTQQAPELTIAAVSDRADPADWLLIRPEAVDQSQPLFLRQNARVGTSSARRESLILAIRPDVQVHSIRGNVPTRLEILRRGECDAVLLAGAGLQRLQLDLSAFRVQRLDPADFPPAPGQGVLAFQCRREDSDTVQFLHQLHHEPTAHQIKAERQVLANLRGGCQLPFGAYAEIVDGLAYLTLSLGQASGGFPRRLRLEHPDVDVLIVEAWKKLHGQLPGSVFVSRDADPEGMLVRACADHGIPLIAQSLLLLEPLKVEWPAITDWVMFSSKTAAREYLRQKPAFTQSVKHAAIGEGTARVLRQSGTAVDFVFDPKDGLGSARAFLKQHPERHILFPQAENGLRSMQHWLIQAGEELNRSADLKSPGDRMLTDLSIYRNTPQQGIVIPETDVMVLTSPMNARNYLDHYPERSKGKFVTIGESTTRVLRESGCRNIYEARKPSELALVEAIFSC